MKPVLFLCVVLLLSGCNPFARFAPDSETLVTRGFARQGDAPPPYPVYCYQTLGEKMCYSSPLKYAPRDRVVGYYGPPPE